MARRFLVLALIILLIGTAVLAAQEQKTTAPITPSARLAAAQSAFLRSVGGSEVPYDVLESSLEGWGRFVLVNSPDEADIVMEISGPLDSGAEVAPARGSQSGVGSFSDVRLAVYDRKTRVLLWSGAEKPKSAWRKKTADDNLVEAAERLIAKFHDQIEPAPAK